MSLRSGINVQTVYLIQIDRYRPGPRPTWHNFLPIDKAELFVLDAESTSHATELQVSALANRLFQIYEGDLESIGVGIDIYEWDSQDKRLMRIICSATRSGSPPDIPKLKRECNLSNDHRTWDEQHWHDAERALKRHESG